VKSPAEVICYACSLIRYWTGLYPKDMHEMMVMLQVPTRLVRVAEGPLVTTTILQLEDIQEGKEGNN
jgi:hypothetical protein